MPSVPLPDTIPTGFQSLDRLLGGGMQRGDLAALGGDVGSGKSALALSVASRVASTGFRVAFLSAEMNPARVRQRLAAMQSRMSLDELRRDQATTEATGSGESPGNDGLLLKQIAAGAGVMPLLHALEEHSIDLAVVDSLEALPSDHGGSDEQSAYAVRLLKAYAVGHDCAVLLIGQCAVGRSDSGPSAGERPRLRDFGAAGAIAWHCDSVLALHREEMYDSGPGTEGAAELHVLKNRHGAAGYVDLYFHKKWLRFEDMLE